MTKEILDNPRTEADVLETFENGEWESVPNLADEIARYAAAASVILAKDKRINIRLSSRDLEDIQTRAAAEGMPYQTLIASVIHKYVTGRLIEAPGATVGTASQPKKVQAA